MSCEYKLVTAPWPLLVNRVRRSPPSYLNRGCASSGANFISRPSGPSGSRVACKEKSLSRGAGLRFWCPEDPNCCLHRHRTIQRTGQTGTPNLSTAMGHPGYVRMIKSWAAIALIFVRHYTQRTNRVKSAPIKETAQCIIEQMTGSLASIVSR